MATVDNFKRTQSEHEETDFYRTQSEHVETDFYLPGISITENLDRIGSFLSRTFGRHGLVLIPDSYNK